MLLYDLLKWAAQGESLKRHRRTPRARAAGCSISVVTKVVTAIVVTVCRGLPEGLNDHGRRERGAPTSRPSFLLCISRSQPGPWVRTSVRTGAVRIGNR